MKPKLTKENNHSKQVLIVLILFTLFIMGVNKLLKMTVEKIIYLPTIKAETMINNQK